jgi:hypothetical protein
MYPTTVTIPRITQATIDEVLRIAPELASVVTLRAIVTAEQAEAAAREKVIRNLVGDPLHGYLGYGTKGKIEAAEDGSSWKITFNIWCD